MAMGSVYWRGFRLKQSARNRSELTASDESESLASAALNDAEHELRP